MKNKRRIQLLIKMCIPLIIILVLSTVGTTFGRFAYLEIKDFYFNSKNFYFNSDKLKTDNVTYNLDNWSGVDTYNIVINMNNNKNNLVHSNSDIAYNITYSCSSNVNCTISKNSGVIYTSSNTDYFVITITPDINNPLDDGDSVWMQVSTTSTSPYIETLQARFVIEVGKIGLSYSIEDEINQPYLKVNITNTLDFYIVEEAFGTYTVGTKIDIDTYRALSNTDKEKCASSNITLNFDPNVVLIDMTDEAYLKASSTNTTIINGFNYINRLTFKIDALSSREIRFYKVIATNNYTYPFGTNASVVTVSYS